MHAQRAGEVSVLTDAPETLRQSSPQLFHFSDLLGGLRGRHQVAHPPVSEPEAGKEPRTFRLQLRGCAPVEERSVRRSTACRSSYRSRRVSMDAQRGGRGGPDWSGDLAVAGSCGLLRARGARGAPALTSFCLPVLLRSYTAVWMSFRGSSLSPVSAPDSALSALVGQLETLIGAETCRLLTTPRPPMCFRAGMRSWTVRRRTH